ncbi:hypothetical protein HDU82_006763 [Entophlyctis luteolus]|nr:hypothetical protein HDU82_006763 [Entophlyctis luteolus]
MSDAEIEIHLNVRLVAEGVRPAYLPCELETASLFKSNPHAYLVPEVAHMCDPYADSQDWHLIVNRANDFACYAAGAILTIPENQADFIINTLLGDILGYFRDKSFIKPCAPEEEVPGVIEIFVVYENRVIPLYNQSIILSDDVDTRKMSRSLRNKVIQYGVHLSEVVPQDMIIGYMVVPVETLRRDLPYKTSDLIRIALDDEMKFNSLDYCMCGSYTIAKASHPQTIIDDVGELPLY